MNNKGKSSLPERNPATHAAHRREVFWQITLPLIIGIIILLGLIAWTILLAVRPDISDLSNWANVSAVWLILPTLVIGLVLAAIFGGITYLVIRLIALIPGYARKVQQIFAQVESTVRNISDKIASVVITVSTNLAKVEGAINAIRGK